MDEYLSAALLTARPGYGWVSEETASRPAEGGEARFFVVDPIDGTRAFLRGDETWCVSIAVVAGGRPVAGVLDAPSLGQVFAAAAGGPATLDGAPIAVRTGHGRARRCASPCPTRCAASSPGGRASRSTSRPTCPRWRCASPWSRNGRLDGTLVGARANDWDIAAADLIIERAGGRLAGLDTGPHLYNQVPKRHGVLVAGAPDIVERLRSYAALAA